MLPPFKPTLVDTVTSVAPPLGPVVGLSDSDDKAMSSKKVKTLEASNCWPLRLKNMLVLPVSLTLGAKHTRFESDVLVAGKASLAKRHAIFDPELKLAPTSDTSVPPFIGPEDGRREEMMGTL